MTPSLQRNHIEKALTAIMVHTYIDLIVGPERAYSIITGGSMYVYGPFGILMYSFREGLSLG